MVSEVCVLLNQNPFKFNFFIEKDLWMSGYK